MRQELHRGSITAMDRSGPTGFTIIELMVSMAVLTLIVVMMAQVINNATVATVAAGRNSDSDTQVRCIFDRIEADLNCALNRDDVDFYVNKKSGNDEIYFYSVADGYYPSGDPAMSGSGRLTARNTDALVGYRLNTGTGGDLERLSRGLHWGDPSPQSGLYTSVAFLPLKIKDCFSQILGDTTNNSTNLSSQWDVIGDQVFRFETSFLLTNGVVSQYPSLSGTTSGGVPTWVRSDVVAVVITLATVDKGTRSMLSSTAALQTLAASLQDAADSSPGSSTTAEQWVQTITGSIKSPPPGIPKAVISSVRVYQRYFYLDGQNATIN